jgi:hypothetical protein
MGIGATAYDGNPFVIDIEFDNLPTGYNCNQIGLIQSFYLRLTQQKMQPAAQKMQQYPSPYLPRQLLIPFVLTTTRR